MTESTQAMFPSRRIADCVHKRSPGKVETVETELGRRLVSCISASVRHTEALRDRQIWDADSYRLARRAGTGQERSSTGEPYVAFCTR